MPRARRHVRGRARGRRMKGDWIILANDPCGTSAEGRLCDDAQNAGNAVMEIALIDSADLSAKQDACTIMRIVGEIPMVVSILLEDLVPASVSRLTYSVYEGIYKSAAHPVTDSGLALALDPLNSDDMESDDWLWRNVRHGSTLLQVPAGGGSFMVTDSFEVAAGAQGTGSHFDIRTKRRLAAGDLLVYAWTLVVRHDVPLGTVGSGRVTASTATEFMQLRGYVKF